MENQRLISITTTWCKNQFFHVLLLRHTALFLWQDCYTALTQIGRKWSIQRQLGTLPLSPTATQKDQNCSRFPSQRMENFFPLSHRTLPNAWISREHSEHKHTLTNWLSAWHDAFEEFRSSRSWPRDVQYIWQKEEQQQKNNRCSSGFKKG